MRRIVTILLVITLCMAYFAIGFSEEPQATDDILFRNIPWESSVDETVSYIKNEFGESISIQQKWIDMKYPSYGKVYLSSDYGINGENIPLICLSVKPKNFEVAGFVVSTIDYYFIPQYNVDDKIVSSNEGRLIQAEYSFSDGKQTEPIFNEICEKLDSLYGKHSSLRSKVKSVTVGKGAYAHDTPIVFNRWQANDTYIDEWPYYLYANGAYISGFQLAYSYLPEMIISEAKELHTLQLTIHNDAIQQEKEAQERKQQEEADKRGTNGL